MARRSDPAPKPKRTRKVKQAEEVQQFEAQPTRRKPVEPLEPKTAGQKRYMGAIRSFDVTFGLGPAGTGKTFLATALAVEALMERRVERIIVTRPAVEAGETLGFLPGEVQEKFDPYLAPVRDVIAERIGKGPTDALIKSGKIEAIPLAYMRGKSFRDAFVILDEAQNTTPKQMMLFLTRIGDGCKVVVNGDEAQCDLRDESGLTDAVRRLKHISSIRFVQLTVDDIVRSGFVRAVVDAYQNAPKGSTVKLLSK